MASLTPARLTFHDFDMQIALTMRQVFCSQTTKWPGAPVPSALLLCSVARDLQNGLPVANDGLMARVASLLGAR